MECPIIKHLFFLLRLPAFAALFAGLYGCYVDKEDELYPMIMECDTSNVTYQKDIAYIMQANCNSCHGGTAPSAGIVTENHTGLKTIADNDRLWGSVSHASGYSPMPKNRPKLNDCELEKIEVWINKGAINN